VKAKLAAIAGLPRVLRKRRREQKRRRSTSRALWHAMDGGWIALKRREKRFDFGRGFTRMSP
jgi:hypothetical protein